MIYRLRGTLVEKDTAGVVIDVGGVGYRASASLATLRALPALGEECVIHTRMVVREDAMLLFGFAEREERAAFDALTAVSKVGPKLALSILSSMSPPEISETVARGDVIKFASVPGLGKKTAERLVLELKGKSLAAFGPEPVVAGSGGGGPYVEARGGREGPQRRATEGFCGEVHKGGGTTNREQALSSEEMDDFTIRGERETEEPPEDITGAAGFGDFGEHPLDPEAYAEDDEPTLRPGSFDEFVGQEALKQNLKIFVQAAKQRDEALDHVLLDGPPGLGKTTLCRILAEEMGVGLRPTSGPTLERAGDMAAILTALEERDFLFIDEIHRLNRQIEEVLYPAMEDFAMDIVLGQGPSARTIRMDLPHFTLVGATTRKGLLTKPLLDRFGVAERLEYYGPEDLEKIVVRNAKILGVPITEGGARQLARRSRGTPRIVNRLLKRVRDYAQVVGDGKIDEETANAALDMQGVDHLGLDRADRDYLGLVIDKFDGGPVGVGTISVALGEARDTVEDVYEPYLLQSGLIQRTPRGRIATQRAYGHLGVPVPNNG